MKRNWNCILLQINFGRCRNNTQKPTRIVNNSTMLSITPNLKNLITPTQLQEFICKGSFYVLVLGHVRSFLFLKQGFCFWSTQYCSVSLKVKVETTLLLLTISYGMDSIWQTPDIFVWPLEQSLPESCHTGECCHQPPIKVLTCCLQWSLA